LCKDLGDELRVIINNDKQVQKKTGNEKVFQDENYRMSVVSALKPVDHVILAIDQDESVCMSLRHIVAVLHNTYGKNIHLIFGKG
jgi:glycerol-3-phosphate cytidylyltransferase-like family protein